MSGVDVQSTQFERNAIQWSKAKSLGFRILNPFMLPSHLRLENLMSFNNKTVVLNFQNCIFGWYLYDCGVSLGDVDLYKTDEILSAWFDGYRRVRNIPKDDRDELPTFLLLYRLQQIYKFRTTGALKTQAICSDFYDQTVLLCKKYLKAYS